MMALAQHEQECKKGRSKMPGEFGGRVALVTGGSRGIGRATALQLARGGADVAIGYASRKEAADAVVAEIRALGRKAVAGPCDVSRQDQIDSLIEATRRDLGPVDLLCHCGAVSNTAHHSELSFDRWFETIDANLNGAFRVVFAVKDEMIVRTFGRIVLFSSVAALRPRHADTLFGGQSGCDCPGPLLFRRVCPARRARQLHCTGTDRNRDGPRAERRANRPHPLGNPIGTARPTRGDRGTCLLSPQRTIELHDRADDRLIRRSRHATVTTLRLTTA